MGCKIKKKILSTGSSLSLDVSSILNLGSRDVVEMDTHNVRTVPGIVASCGSMTKSSLDSRCITYMCIYLPMMTE